MTTRWTRKIRVHKNGILYTTLGTIDQRETPTRMPQKTKRCLEVCGAYGNKMGPKDPYAEVMQEKMLLLYCRLLVAQTTESSSQHSLHPPLPSIFDAIKMPKIAVYPHHIHPSCVEKAWRRCRTGR